jgi:hypothetical protein
MRDSAGFDVLAARLEELARTCDQLAAENAGLRAEVSRLSGSLAAVVPESGPGRAGPGGKHAGGRRIRVSRRGFGVVLAGAAAAAFGATLFERGARHPALAEVTSPGAAGADAAVTGQLAPAAVTAAGSFLSATLSSSTAVIAAANNGAGPAIQGLAGGTGPGMYAASAGTGPAVSASSARTAAGIVASSGQGRGGIFSGKAVAQVQLTPGGSSPPKSGQMGDLYADSAGRLWYCKKSGLSATWKQIA